MINPSNIFMKITSVKQILKYFRLKCEFMLGKTCSLPNYCCEYHYGKDWRSCTAADFFKEYGHTDYKAEQEFIEQVSEIFDVPLR